MAAVGAHRRARYPAPAARSVPSLSPVCWGRLRVSQRDLSRASGVKEMPAPGATRSLRCRRSVNKTRWQPALSEKTELPAEPSAQREEVKEPWHSEKEETPLLASPLTLQLQLSRGLLDMAGNV